ncbi:galactosyltransferase-like protein [Micromonospora pisi]|uniref:Galactosyltransferase-like protein n=1 Tax=Micromonospora pisi TaxID=589240 RepID=A0A495JV34_9ACTN|nr:glycosyltransferase family 2 protein [Micromonospora pisi]RKR92375.1 galactosyltransferase-like protein [Micromonospora pisi]
MSDHGGTAAPLPLSVVIPVLNHGHLLDLTLDGFTRQTLPADRFEVIVVDDGSTPSLETVVSAYAGRLPLTYLRNERNGGRSVARNRGIRAARGEVVVFVDADHCPHPDLLRRHLDFHTGRSLRPGVLLGRSLMVDWAAIGALRAGRTPTETMLGDYREDVRDYLFAAENHRRDFPRAPWLYGHTNNASVDRATLEAIGGFDEALVTWGGEDNELFYRIFHQYGRAADTFAIGTDAICYAVPHLRAWPVLMAQLAENYRTIAAKHPRYDMELLGYPGNWATLVRRIAWFEDALDVCRERGLGRVTDLPSTLLDRLDGGDSLLVGFGASKLRLGPDAVTFDYDAPLGERNPHLMGLMTPYAERRFDRVVNVDLWRFFNPEDLGGYLLESLRVAGRVELVRTEDRIRADELLPLPFVDDLEFLRSTVEPYFPVEITTVDGVTVLAMGGA